MTPESISRPAAPALETGAPLEIAMSGASERFDAAELDQLRNVIDSVGQQCA